MSGVSISVADLPAKVLAEFAAAAAKMPIVPVQGYKPSTHVGDADVPWVDLGDGSEFQLLKVDLSQGQWITRNRMKPGTRVIKHYHTGPVLAFTVQGAWYYEEDPDTVNRAGSFLHESAGSCHTLCVADDIVEETIVWFAISGSNLNIDETGNIVSVVDAFNILAAYRALCEAAGHKADKVIVVGEAD